MMLERPARTREDEWPLAPRRRHTPSTSPAERACRPRRAAGSRRSWAGRSTTSWRCAACPGRRRRSCTRWSWRRRSGGGERSDQGRAAPLRPPGVARRRRPARAHRGGRPRRRDLGARRRARPAGRRSRGDDAGEPALLMTRLPGRPQVHPTPGWLGELASIHERLAGWASSATLGDRGDSARPAASLRALVPARAPRADLVTPA